MKELSIRELQLHILNIMLDVSSFCENNNINYSLAYGTLIGAIRHNGFIPWDDDADFIMPRPDFDYFCKKYTSNRYRIIYYGNDKTALACFARIVDCKETYFQTERPWTSQESGVWLDIIPIDGIEDSQEAYSKRYNKLKKWCQIAYKFRRQNHHIIQNDSLLSKTKTIFARILGLNGRLGAIIIKHMVKIITLYSYEGSKYVGQCAILDDGPYMFPIKDFASYVPVNFEGYVFKSIIGYDHHLRQLYGNYMQLPPVEKQVSHQWWIKLFLKR